MNKTRRAALNAIYDDLNAFRERLSQVFLDNDIQPSTLSELMDKLQAIHDEEEEAGENTKSEEAQQVSQDACQAMDEALEIMDELVDALELANDDTKLASALVQIDEAKGQA